MPFPFRDVGPIDAPRMATQQPAGPTARGSFDTGIDPPRPASQDVDAPARCRGQVREDERPVRTRRCLTDAQQVLLDRLQFLPMLRLRIRPRRNPRRRFGCQRASHVAVVQRCWGAISRVHQPDASIIRFRHEHSIRRRRMVAPSIHRLDIYQLTGSALPSSYPAADWRPTSARSWNSATVAAPA